MKKISCAIAIGDKWFKICGDRNNALFNFDISFDFLRHFCIGVGIHLESKYTHQFWINILGLTISLDWFNWWYEKNKSKLEPVINTDNVA